MVFHNRGWGGVYNNEENSKFDKKEQKKNQTKLAYTSTERAQSTRVECA